MSSASTPSPKSVPGSQRSRACPSGLGRGDETRHGVQARGSSGVFRVCAVVPTYNNPHTVQQVVSTLLDHVECTFVVDDGSSEESALVLAQLAQLPGVRVHHRTTNGGKGAAVKTGLELAKTEGYTHALQVDADGQHDLSAVPQFLSAARERPACLLLGFPCFDGSVPKGRLIARQLTVFWCAVETLGRKITDPMCGFRMYPIAETLQTRTPSDRMDFDPEVAVRLVWSGVCVVNLPVRVRYLSAEEGGVSHYRMWGDTLAITVMHWRLMLRLLFVRPLCEFKRIRSGR